MARQCRSSIGPMARDSPGGAAPPAAPPDCSGELAAERDPLAFGRTLKLLVDCGQHPVVCAF
jgi:hypothetical protein